MTCTLPDLHLPSALPWASVLLCNQVGFGKWQLLSTKLKDHKFSPHFYFNYVDTRFNFQVSEGMPNSVIRVGALCRAVLQTFLELTSVLTNQGPWSSLQCH